MAQQDIRIGPANQGDGMTLFEAFTIVQENFTELYTDESQGEVNSIVAGAGVSVSSATGNVTVTNTAPDQTVTLTEGQNVTITGTYPNFTIASNDVVGAVTSVNAGTGVSVDQTTGIVTVTNSAPDQTVSLADGGDIAVSGTYPSFTLTNSAPNYNHTGEVTGATALTIANDVISYAKLAAEFTTTAAVGATTLDFSTAQVFTKANSGTVTYTISNADIGMTKDLTLTGTGSFSITGGKLIAGEFVESTTNFVQIVAQSSSTFWYSISQEQ